MRTFYSAGVESIDLPLPSGIANDNNCKAKPLLFWLCKRRLFEHWPDDNNIPKLQQGRDNVYFWWQLLDLTKLHPTLKAPWLWGGDLGAILTSLISAADYIILMLLLWSLDPMYSQQENAEGKKESASACHHDHIAMVTSYNTGKPTDQSKHGMWEMQPRWREGMLIIPTLGSCQSCSYCICYCKVIQPNPEIMSLRLLLASFHPLLSREQRRKSTGLCIFSHIFKPCKWKGLSGEKQIGTSEESKLAQEASSLC